MDKIEALELVGSKLLQGELTTAKEIIQTEYPFKKLINPGFLKVLSYYMDVFPYHAHWKMEKYN